MKKLKILAVLFTLVTLTNVHAALQSRPGVNAKLNLAGTNYFQYMREMEAEGGAIGLNATFVENSTTQEYEETSASNNVDSHMCKSVEWGAAAMLSASDYGAGDGNVTSNYDATTKMYDKSASTTGNLTGIFGMYKGAAESEITAGAIITKLDSYYGKYLKSASIRYVDVYPEETNSGNREGCIPGDAIYEMYTFKSGGGYKPVNNYPMCWRGEDGAAYGKFGRPDYSIAWGAYGSRLVVWVGDGI